MKGAIAMDSRKRMRHFLLAGGAIALLIIAGGASCKFGAPNYTLTVLLAAGVTGTPATGQYTYKELTQVSFTYTAVNTLCSVEAFLNSKIRYSGTGTITLFADGYKLTADIIDLRGTWNVALTKDGDTSPTYLFSIMMTGPDVLSGTFTDSRGYHGTWTGSSGALTLTYTDWVDFVLTGTVYSMSGSYTGNSTSGSWSASKSS
jgi:hypothetical protein